jgi:hypothetical protein
LDLYNITASFLPQRDPDKFSVGSIVAFSAFKVVKVREENLNPPEYYVLVYYNSYNLFNLSLFTISEADYRLTLGYILVYIKPFSLIDTIQSPNVLMKIKKTYWKKCHGVI